MSPKSAWELKVDKHTFWHTVTIATAVAPIVLLLLAPFAFAIAVRTGIGNGKVSACSALGIAVVIASVWNIVHQLVIHGNKLQSVRPVVHHVIAFALSAAFVTATLLLLFGPHGVADLLLAAAAVGMNATVRVLGRIGRQGSSLIRQALTRESVAFAIALWIVSVAQGLAHFHAHEDWAISGICAIVAFAQALYVAELCTGSWYRETAGDSQLVKPSPRSLWEANAHDLPRETSIHELN